MEIVQIFRIHIIVLLLYCYLYCAMRIDESCIVCPLALTKTIDRKIRNRYDAVLYIFTIIHMNNLYVSIY
jgi:hypothetical protein